MLANDIAGKRRGGPDAEIRVVDPPDQDPAGRVPTALLREGKSLTAAAALLIVFYQCFMYETSAMRSDVLLYRATSGPQSAFY